ncbi:FecR family protein [Methylocystis iwaonis]|nr:FecR domain-containing protein [Methylocystis iwaonis]
MMKRMDDDASDRDDGHDAAIEWWLQEKAGEIDGERRIAFEAWLAADPAHAQAYTDITEMFSKAQGLRRARYRQVHGVRRTWRAAAGVALAASLAFFGWLAEFANRHPADYSTGVGERRTVTLTDGSRVELDSHSAIAVRFEAGLRRVTLLSGEAWFEVAPIASRPFVVEAAGGTVTALGTAFDVALQKNGARVAVSEHAVAVASGGERLIVETRQETSYEADTPARAPVSVAAENVAAWRRGALVVEDRSLGEALTILGRYRYGYVFCLRASTCARRVSGVFSTAEPLTTLREIEFFLGLRAIHLTNYLIFLTE